MIEKIISDTFVSVQFTSGIQKSIEFLSLQSQAIRHVHEFSSL